MKLIIDIPDKEWEEWKNGLGIIHTKPLTEALEKAKPLQAELEEIKAEINSLSTNNFLGMIPKGEAIYILDKRITEIEEK